MSFQNPVFPAGIPRQLVEGAHVAEFAKMFDPPNESPATPDLVAATNPVPEVMAAGGFQNPPAIAHTVHRRLMSNTAIAAFDGKVINFFTISDADNPATALGTWPAATIRVPRGVVFHADSQGAGPPPHTIHWHGIEPTAINDGVGHCSMEIGGYIYQWQPNQIGSYFYHCHRNTVQHFEFGLYGFIVVEPPDAFFASSATDPALGVPTLNGIPIGACRDGRRRTAANLVRVGSELTAGTGNPASGHGYNGFSDMSGLFPGYVHGAITDADTATTFPNVPSVPVNLRGQPLPQWLRFQTNPHAMTVPYDVEAIWVADDRSSVWSDLASGARDTMPRAGGNPGVDDQFDAGRGSFNAFNQFDADYWYVTGVNFPGTKVGRIDNLGAPGTGTGTIPPGIVVPPALMSGVSGVQVSVEAQVGQTVLLRCLNGAYNDLTVTLPVDAIIIAWDGRGLGVGPLAQYNHAYRVPAGTPVHISVARRFDALIKPTAAINSFATVQFTETTAEENAPGGRPVIFTGRIPFNISPVVGTLSISGSVVDSQTGLALAGVQMNLSGASTAVVQTNAQGNYTFPALPDGSYVVTPSQAGAAFSPRERTVLVSGADMVGQFFRGRTP